ncbi:MAG: CPBP family glutamic-type intramembrane protease [Bacilli bacterium]
MSKTLDYVNNLSTKKFITLSVLLGVISTIPFSIIGILFNIPFNGIEIDNNFMYIYIIIIGPIIESIFIIIITKIVGIFTKNKFTITIITAVIFACNHTYSLIYIFTVFIPGLTFVYAYMIYDNKDKKLSSFWIMTIIHMIYNLIQALF